MLSNNQNTKTIQNRTNGIDSQNLEKLSFTALQRISEGLAFLADDTSCKVAGKYILLTIANIQKEEDRTNFNLTGSSKEDLQNMKNFLKAGKIIQIEFVPNHHIVIFAKNQTHLYILQAFWKIYQLKDWMRNLENMTPKDMEAFFAQLELLLDETNEDIDAFNNRILEMFMPSYFIDDQEKIQQMKDWFKRATYCYIKKADVLDYNFKNDPLDPNYFGPLFKEIDHTFLLRVSPEQKRT